MGQSGLRFLAVIACAASLSGCTERPAAAPTFDVRVPVYSTTTAFAPRMFAAYASFPSQLHFINVPTTRTTPEVFERGEVDVAATSADAAYFLYRESGEGANQANQIRAIAALQQVPTHLVVRNTPGIRSAHDLRAVGYLHSVSVSDRVQERVARELGISRAVPLAREAALAFTQPDIDAMLLPGDYPAPAIDRLLKRGARLFDIDHDAIARLQRDYPFIRGMVIPAGTYEGQTEAVHTIGIRMMLVCRNGLRDDIVHELTRHLFQVLATLRDAYPELRRLEMRQALATPIPLHPGAATFYREMELGP